MSKFSDIKKHVFDSLDISTKENGYPIGDIRQEAMELSDEVDEIGKYVNRGGWKDQDNRLREIEEYVREYQKQNP